MEIHIQIQYIHQIKQKCYIKVLQMNPQIYYWEEPQIQIITQK